MLKTVIVSKHIHMYDTTEVLENKIGKKYKSALSCQMFISVSLKIVSKIPAERYCTGIFSILSQAYFLILWKCVLAHRQGG